MSVGSPFLWHVLPGVACALLLSGCIVLPTAAPQEEKPFSGTMLDFIDIGVTTRAEVHETLAALPHRLQPRRFGDDSFWLYRGSRDTWGWEICIGGGYVAGCERIDSGRRRTFFLSIEFDESGVVSAWDVSSTLGQICANDRVCSNFWGTMVFANEELDARLRQLSAPVDQCAIYVYATLPGERGVFTARVDGLRHGGLLTNEGYLRFMVGLGKHEVQTQYIFRHGATEVEVDCVGGNEFFIHHDYGPEGATRTKPVIVSDSVGRAALADKRLVLLAYSPETSY